MNRGKSIGLVVIVVLVLGAALYLGGMWHGRSQVSGQKEQCLKQLKYRDGQLAAAESQVNFFKARAALYQTALDLDQRNFGLANAHLREADEPLAKLKPESLGINKPLLDDLRQEIANTNIQVATDLDTQRYQILNFERRLDSLIAKPAVPPIMPQVMTTPSLPPAAPAPEAPIPAAPPSPEAK